MFARCERHLCQPDEYKTSTFTRDTATARLLIQILYTHMSSIRSDNDGCLDFEKVLRIVCSVSWNTKLSFGSVFQVLWGSVYQDGVFSSLCWDIQALAQWSLHSHQCKFAAWETPIPASSSVRIRPKIQETTQVLKNAEIILNTRVTTWRGSSLVRGTTPDQQKMRRKTFTSVYSFNIFPETLADILWAWSLLPISSTIEQTSSRTTRLFCTEKILTG